MAGHHDAARPPQQGPRAEPWPPHYVNGSHGSADVSALGARVAGSCRVGRLRPRLNAEVLQRLGRAWRRVAGAVVQQVLPKPAKVYVADVLHEHNRPQTVQAGDKESAAGHADGAFCVVAVMDVVTVVVVEVVAVLLVVGISTSACTTTGLSRWLASVATSPVVAPISPVAAAT